MKAIYVAWGYGDCWLMGVGSFEGVGLLDSEDLVDREGVEAMRSALGDRYQRTVAKAGFFARQVVTDNTRISESAFAAAARKDDGIIGFSLLLHTGTAAPGERVLTDRFIVEHHLERRMKGAKFSAN